MEILIIFFIVLSGNYDCMEITTGEVGLEKAIGSNCLKILLF